LPAARLVGEASLRDCVQPGEHRIGCAAGARECGGCVGEDLLREVRGLLGVKSQDVV
jgi:hypothetical protein